MKNNIYKYIFILVTSLFLTGCYERERICTDFKTGKFKYEYTIGDKKFTSEFERTADLEIANIDGHIDTTSIRWINDCEYVGHKVNPKNMQEKKAVHIKILSTTENSYNFEFNIVGEHNKQKGTVTKIN
jgi:major membrane immunogen (membrane-anchored lipoprotein)